MYKEELLERFLRYVKINTCSDETSDAVPSTRHQFDLADILKDELLKLGINDAYVDEHCYVYGHLEATKGHENDKGIAFIAHMETSYRHKFEKKPQVIKPNLDCLSESMREVKE